MKNKKNSSGYNTNDFIPINTHRVHVDKYNDLKQKLEIALNGLNKIASTNDASLALKTLESIYEYEVLNENRFNIDRDALDEMAKEAEELGLTELTIEDYEGE